jgi:hypothetical protein
MRLPQGRRYDHLRHLATDHLGLPVTEGLLRRRIEVGDAAGLVDADDAVERRLEDRALACFACLELDRACLGYLFLPCRPFHRVAFGQVGESDDQTGAMRDIDRHRRVGDWDHGPVLPDPPVVPRS